MGRNFVDTWYVRPNVVLSCENTTSVNSTGFDMSGYDQIVGILALSSALSAPSSAGSTAISIYALEATVQSTGTADGYVALTSTRVTCTTAADNVLICEVHKTGDRYVRFTIDGTTAVYSHLTVLQGPAKSQPVTQPTGTIDEIHISPTTGTA